jgi:hypothetical protein
MRVEWEWRDQGWGNQKGNLQLELLRSGEVVGTVGLSTAVARHEWESKTFEIEVGDFIDQCQPATWIRVMRIVGGGGGHELYVRNLRIGFLGRKPTPKPKSDQSRFIMDSYAGLIFLD